MPVFYNNNSLPEQPACGYHCGEEFKQIPLGDAGWSIWVGVRATWANQPRPRPDRQRRRLSSTARGCLPTPIATGSASTANTLMRTATMRTSPCGLSK
jgi:hypothetical protein